MATRYSRAGGNDFRSDGGGRPRRWAVFSLATLALMGGLVWIAPTLLVLTSLRDRPLQAAFAGIDGRLTTGGATWEWFGGIEYRDVVLWNRSHHPVAVVRRMTIDRGLAALAFDPSRLGTVRLAGGAAVVEVRRGGSTIEDLLAPWLAARSRPADGATVSFELEVVDAAVELVDLDRHDSWRFGELLAAGTVRTDGTLTGWTLATRVTHAGPPDGDNALAIDRLLALGHAVGGGADGLDPTRIAAATNAILAREGGLSVSSINSSSPAVPRRLAVAANGVPLGVSSVLATRFDATHVLDGLADARLDVSLPAADGVAGDVAGSLLVSRLAVCRADTLAEIVALERCDLPLDVSLEGSLLTVRTLKATCPLFKAEASGRIRLPRGGSWEWAESLIGEDFALAADVDLTAAARSIPGGLAVRPDVRVTGGQLQLSAAAHADGGDRLLEVRASCRDLTAVQGVAAGAGGSDRLLRWDEPFNAWLRGRRGPARNDRLRVEEARLSSSALEFNAAGDAEAATAHWTLDIGRLAAAAAEVFELRDVAVAGMARGRLDMTRMPATGVSTVHVSASVADFERIAAGRPEWRDKEITIEAEGRGSPAGGAVLVDRAHAVLAADDDRLELTLTGGALVDCLAGAGFLATGTAATPWVRPAPSSQGPAADCSIVGDLGRWQARCEGLQGAVDAGDLVLAGRMELAAAVAARGDDWQVTRCGGEIEKLVATFSGRRIAEPRVVVTAAGLLSPAAGRLDLSSAEVLTTSLSLRTGGMSLLVGRGGQPDGALDRLRGRVQWQADAGRIAPWIVPTGAAERWPVAGRGWGTVEILDTPAGPNLRVEATGSQLSLSAAADHSGPSAPPRQVWAEPRATIFVEVTRRGTAGGDRLTVDRLALQSSTVAIEAQGSLDEWSSRRLLELDGTLSYDWELLTRLLTPWTGGRLRIAGGGARPFVLRGPLGAAAVTTAAGAAAVPPLPADWLVASGSPVAEGGVVHAPTVAVPVATPTSSGGRSGGDPSRWLRTVSVDTSTAWSAAEIEGFPVEAGEMAVRLFEGQLALGPFDVAASGGRLRGAPWLRLLPLPGELIVPPGRVVDRIALNGHVSEGWVAWIVPLVGHSTRTEGFASVDIAGARLPLADPFGGELSGQILFENLQVTPGGRSQPLVNLIAKLQSVIDPRFAFGDKAVILRVRPEPVRVKLVDRRLWHEGLVMDMGQLVVRTGGSVGADGSLAMTTEVAFRGDIAGATPVIGRLLRTPLRIPLGGTVSRPQFDAAAIDGVLGRIVENTAEAVINDGLNRGLEAIFGNPPPAP